MMTKNLASSIHVGHVEDFRCNPGILISALVGQDVLDFWRGNQRTQVNSLCLPVSHFLYNSERETKQEKETECKRKRVRERGSMGGRKEGNI